LYHYFDNKLDAAGATKLTASTVLDSKTGDVIIKIVNGDDTPREINIRLGGLSSKAKVKATKTVLTGPNAVAVNEDGKAPVVKPEAFTESVNPSFTFTVPANSSIVYRIDR
jgi:alpha-N-arabinofuranosidase